MNNCLFTYQHRVSNLDKEVFGDKVNEIVEREMSFKLAAHIIKNTNPPTVRGYNEGDEYEKELFVFDRADFVKYIEAKELEWLSMYAGHHDRESMAKNIAELQKILNIGL